MPVESDVGDTMIVVIPTEVDVEFKAFVSEANIMKALSVETEGEAVFAVVIEVTVEIVPIELVE